MLQKMGQKEMYALQKYFLNSSFFGTKNNLKNTLPYLSRIDVLKKVNQKKPEQKLKENE